MNVHKLRDTCYSPVHVSDSKVELLLIKTVIPISECSRYTIAKSHKSTVLPGFIVPLYSKQR